MKTMLILIPDIRELIQAGRTEELADILDDLHPVDIAEIISELQGDEKVKLFNLVRREKAIDVFDELDEDDQIYILEHLPAESKAFLLNEMSPDERADLFEELTTEKSQEYESLMTEEARREVEILTSYPSETAGGLMTTEYASVVEGMTVGEAIDFLRATAPDKETIYSIYVTSEKGVLVGVVQLKDLILSDPRKRISDIMDEKVISVDVDTDQEEVARVMKKYNLMVIPVVDRYRKLLGIITVDDIIDVIHEEASEDMAKMVGTQLEDIETLLSPLKSARLRMPWLLLTYIGEILVSFIVKHFEPTLQQIIALASYMPLIAAMGGNVGTQASTICVRGLATGSIKMSDLSKILVKETLAGSIMGIVYGFILSLITLLVYGFKYSYTLPITVFIGCTASMTFASVMGTIEPFVLIKLKRDPATAVGPLVTTGTDILSTATYLTIATLLLKALN
ncbi:magnesium transporter [Candidatus Thermokryptus mobilis]|mgnify:CR=1 FL=1|uniref:Magnesium transporter MgtE n=1 Tax=Candidatus Thermokryptus mobilis TaxID=1643428 RepID=A0A0S4ND25_9BACT|nr:magnesium transporter [Candidatus Thermokryptus mobilis]CUU08079.1 magnesium transporter [Candidatus Thermokryptus mobilis]